jgi:glycosyltransferase involved in cell wall biosynthesis
VCYHTVVRSSRPLPTVKWGLGIHSSVSGNLSSDTVCFSNDVSARDRDATDGWCGVRGHDAHCSVSAAACGQRGRGAGGVMRLLHAALVYAPAWSYGGTVRSVTAISEAVAARGVHVTVVTTTAGTEWRGSRKPVWKVLNGVEVCYCPAKRTPAGLWSRSGVEVLRQQAAKATVGHLTTVWAPFGIAAHRAFRRYGLPYVSSPRGTINSYSFSNGSWKKWPYYWLFERRIQEDAAALHATSPLEVSDLSSYFPGKEIAHIPNMCAPDRWYPDPSAAEAWRREHGIDRAAVVMLYAGRIEPKKNLAFMARVQTEVSRKTPCMFVTIGPAEPAALAAVRRAFRDCGAAEPLILPGTGDDGHLRAAYSAADAFVLPSHHENFSNVVVEAAMCGTPVIASRNVGVACAMAEIGCASVEALQSSAWVGAVLSSAGRRLSQASMGQLSKTFSPECVAHALIDIYQRVERGRAGE